MRLLLPVLLLAAAPALAAGPDYVVIRNQVTVDRPIAAVWSRVGGWCQIADWLKVKCEASGPNGVGGVRTLNGVTVEAMVAQTPHSYTYWQSTGNMTPYSYHGTLAAEPDGAGRTTLVYTLFYDQAGMTTDAVRASEHQRIDGRFRGALTAMKQLAEAK